MHVAQQLGAGRVQRLRRRALPLQRAAAPQLVQALAHLTCGDELSSLTCERGVVDREVDGKGRLLHRDAREALPVLRIRHGLPDLYAVQAGHRDDIASHRFLDLDPLETAEGVQPGNPGTLRGSGILDHALLSEVEAMRTELVETRERLRSLVDVTKTRERDMANLESSMEDQREKIRAREAECDTKIAEVKSTLELAVTESLRNERESVRQMREAAERELSASQVEFAALRKAVLHGVSDAVQRERAARKDLVAVREHLLPKVLAAHEVERLAGLIPPSQLHLARADPINLQ